MLDLAVLPRPADLPEFDRPPVVEVALGAHWPAIRGMRQAHLGLFWNAIRDDYPRTQDQPRLDPPPPLLGPGQAQVQLEFMDSPPTSRAWFISEDDTMLVQVQDDRLVHNWRGDGNSYERFEPHVERFWSCHDALVAALADGGLSVVPKIEVVEVTYINWIAGVALDELLRYYTSPKFEAADVMGLRAERWAAQFGLPKGVLSVDVQPAVRPNNGETEVGYQLVLATLAPTTGDRDDVEAVMWAGRNAIVRSFTELTTDRMHDEWRRTR